MLTVYGGEKKAINELWEYEDKWIWGIPGEYGLRSRDNFRKEKVVIISNAVKRPNKRKTQNCLLFFATWKLLVTFERVVSV